jgi:hypothetical protein
MIRRNVDVLAVAILLGVLALCSTARSITPFDLFERAHNHPQNHRQVVLTHFDRGHLVIVSCHVPPSLVIR